MQSDVALLVYAPLKKKRKDDSFDGNDNIGALVVRDLLQRAGITVGYCTPETSAKYRVVLVSLTSTYDVYSLYQKIHARPDWQPGKRPMTVIAGGFGMQNPYPLRNLIDYALFGRAEGVIVEMVTALLGGSDFAHPAVMRLPEISGVTINQVAACYPHPIEYGAGKVYQEVFIGCRNKCKFCHYAWARDRVGDDGEYENMTLAGSASKEITWRGLLRTTGKLGRVRSALDGFSERLRYLYGKRISNAEIVAGIERLGGYGGNTVCILYNIANMPGETMADREEFAATVAKARPESRVILVLHSTPFRPSMGTPMQQEPVTLYPDWHKFGAQVIHDSPLVRVVHSTGNESPWSHLLSVVAERSTAASDKLFHALATHPRLQSGQSAVRIRLVEHNFDLTPYLREYAIGDGPGWWFGDAPSRRRLERVASIMRQRAAAVKK